LTRAPPNSTVASSGLDQALVALHRRAAIGFADLTVGMDGTVYPVTRKNTSVWEAVALSPGSRGDVAQWYKAAVHRCGRTVAGQTWAFNMSFAHAQNVITGANIALLVKTRGGWSLYGGLSGSPPWR